MKIERLVIENFKSIERIELIQPSPFTVFVGPNGSGKSNIFEALEFLTIARTNSSAPSLFRGYKNFMRRQRENDKLSFNVKTEVFSYELEYLIENTAQIKPFPNFKLLDFKIHQSELSSSERESKDFEQLFENFSHLFVGSSNLVKLPFNDNSRLALDASNLEPVLKRILQDSVLRNEIFEWLEIFVPGFKVVEIDDRNELHWFEESSSDYYTKDLISDGTYNILALLTAVYQIDDKPQFLCIEEPENGLHPQVAGELTDFFRTMCEERGHHIWLNTHSQSIMARLKPEEMIVVEKKAGRTQTIQYKDRDFHGLRMDEALLSNVLGAGRAW